MPGLKTETAMPTARQTAVVALAASTLVLAGCGGGGARQIDTRGSDVITTVDDVDIQNYLEAANELTASMLESGEFSRVLGDDRFVLLELDRVANDTADPYIDTQLLTDTIRTNVVKSGLARFITPGYESPLSADDRAAAEFTGQRVQQPAYTLSGRISDVRARAGRDRQSTFIFKLTLSDRNGVAIWEDQRFITKQGRRPKVGIG